MRDFISGFFRLAHLALQNVNKDYIIFSYFHNFVAKSDQKPEMMKDERNKYLVKSKEMAELNTSFEKKNYPNVYLFVVLLLTVFYNLIAFKPNWLANFQIIILITLGFFWSTSNLIFFSLSGTLLISMGFRIINLVHFLATCIRVAAVVPGNGSLDFFPAKL